MRAKWVAVAVAGAGAAYAAERARRGRDAEPARAAAPVVARPTIPAASAPVTAEPEPGREPDAPVEAVEAVEPVAAPEPEPEPGPEPDEVLTATSALEPVLDVPAPEREPQPEPEPVAEPVARPTVAVPAVRAVPEPERAPEREPEPETEPELELETDDEAGSTKVALSGFYVGLVCMLFAPVLYFSATDWLFDAETSAELTPFVLLLLAVPAILVALPRTRRFGLYMVLGLALTGVVVAATAIVVLFLLFRAG